MRRTCLSALFILVSLVTTAQQITNTVMLDENKSITTKKKHASFLIVTKKISETEFQQLNYNYKGPLMNMQTFSDASLSVLDGFNLIYNPDGKLAIAGYYTKNKKDRTWYYYNDTFKVIKKEVYLQGELLETIDPDTIPRSENTGLLPGEKEAAFKGGPAAWRKFLVSNLNADAGAKSVKGGQVLVSFTLNKYGEPRDIYLRKSVELILDEEALRVIYLMPDWEPAEQKGRKVNAYRVQPITFAIIK